MDGYLFKNNKFIENNNDVVICAGDNIVFEENEFSSTVYMYGRATNYKFLNNKFENIKQSINYEYSTPTVITGNTYINSKFALTKKASEGKVDISNEKLINSSINSMSEGDEIRKSSIISDESISLRLAGVYKDCTINVKRGDFINPKIYNCEIKDTEVYIQGQAYLENCNISNTIMRTTSNTEKMNFSKSNFEDSMIGVSSWGKEVELIVENNIINMKSKNRPIVEFSAGKMKRLNFRSNTVINDVNISIINMNDASYSIPNGNILIENNNITQKNDKYIVDGVNINKGIVNFREVSNNLNGSTMLSPKYINNQYFKIIR